jgi:anti-sigma factor RsiW
MSNEHVTELISALVDVEIAPDESRTLFTHLGNCTSCQDFFQDLLRLQGEVRTIASRELTMTAPEGVFSRIALAETRVARSEPSGVKRPRSIWRTRFVISAPAAAIVALMIALWTMALSSIFLSRENPASPPATYYQYRGFDPSSLYGSSDPRWQN